MRNTLISSLVYLLGNAIGLLLAMALLPGFSIGLTAFIIAVLLFSALLLALKPLILKYLGNTLPGIEGGIALITTFAGLFLTSLLLSDMHIGGLSNWILATLLVWMGALLGGVMLNHWLHPHTKKSDKNS